MKHEEHKNSLRCVLFKEEDAWVAMCLERYIGAQGRSKEEAVQRLKIVYRAELDDSCKRTGKPFGDIPPAPDHVHLRWKESDSSMRGIIFDQYGDELELAA